jgi:hypothetical protein
VQIQPFFGKPWPTVVFEAGIGQQVTDIIGIRDNILGHTTGVNIFFAVKYIENSEPELASWWACLAVRNTNAPPIPPNADPKEPTCLVLGELAKVDEQYQRLDVAITGNPIWRVPTYLLFHPEPIPVVVPPLPPTLDIDLEAYRHALLRTR